jgi:DNA-binding NtrC family response regulator
MSSSRKILFVDDDPNFLASLQRTFRQQLSFDTASSALEALALLKNQGPYAVIVADISMPGMSGIELLAKVTELAPETVQVLLTGSTDLETFVAAVEGRNIFRYLAKPCDVDALRGVIIEGLKRYGGKEDAEMTSS